jgi:hypothetical protein
MKLATSRSATLPFGQRTSFKYNIKVLFPDFVKGFSARFFRPPIGRKSVSRQRSRGKPKADNSASLIEGAG